MKINIEGKIAELSPEILAQSAIDNCVNLLPDFIQTIYDFSKLVVDATEEEVEQWCSQAIEYYIRHLQKADTNNEVNGTTPDNENKI